MFTENELRTMLRASADRVPTEETEPQTGSPSDTGTVVEIGHRSSRRKRNRFIAPVAVAASVAAVITGVVALAQRPGAGHAAKAHTSAAHGGATHQNPVHPRPRPGFTGAITDVVKIDTRHSTENLVEPVHGAGGQQDIVSQIGHDRTVNLVIAPAGAFDDAAISRRHPVAIGGTTGYYDVLRLFPLSADGKGGSAPTGTIVFRTPDRHWAFAWLQKNTHNNTRQGTPVDDPSAIVDGFDSLHASFAAGTYRTPVSLGYLPEGTSFVQADQTFSRGKLTLASLTAEGSGNKELDVTLESPQFVSHIIGGPNDNYSNCSTPQERKIVRGICTVTRVRNLPGGFQLIVQGTQYSAAETQRVLDHVTVAKSPGTDTHYFPLRQAVLG